MPGTPGPLTALLLQNDRKFLSAREREFGLISGLWHEFLGSCCARQVPDNCDVLQQFLWQAVPR